MGGIIGRLFREFAVTLTMAIMVSMLVSLTTTPMMCAALLRSRYQEKHGKIYQANERIFDWILRCYEKSLGWVLRHQPLILFVTLLTMGATAFLYVNPQGIFSAAGYRAHQWFHSRATRTSPFSRCAAAWRSWRRSCWRARQWPQ
jgi:multidrug efflux pump